MQSEVQAKKGSPAIPIMFDSMKFMMKSFEMMRDYPEIGGYYTCT